MTVRLPRRQRFALGAGLAVLGVVALAGGFAAGIGRAQSPENETPEAVASETETAVATPSPTATPTPFVPPTPVEDLGGWKPQLLPPERPFGLMEAEPYRVFTGDGDCLNLRPAPGTTFGGDPRTCVPEGFLLWLFGPEKEADGMTWRYALGEGWVATQYVQPAPEAERGMGPFGSVSVRQQAGDGSAFARISGGGDVTEYPPVPFGGGGIGVQPAVISPDGRWVAYSDWNTSPQAMVLIDLEIGFEQRFPRMLMLDWSSSGTMLVRDDLLGKLGWMSPMHGVFNEIPNAGELWGSWTADGQSVIGSSDGTTIVRLFLDGTRQEVKVDLEEDAYLGELSISPDGSRVLSVSYLGDIRVIDVATGGVTVLARAPQFEGGGKCGGSTGKLSAWLDDNTVVWHESYAPRGQNGITIANVDGGIQRVIPFFSIQDLKVVAPGMISFTTWEWFEDQPGLVLTWLLDAERGEGRPVAVGGFGVWQ